MKPKIKYHLLLATAFSFALVNTIEVTSLTPQHNQWLTLDSEAQAKKSGGRSGGGSFQKRSSPTRSSDSNSNSSPSRNTSPSYNTSPSNNDTYRDNDSGGSSTIVVPDNHNSSSSSSGSTAELMVLLLVLLVFGVLFAILSCVILVAFLKSFLKGSDTVEQERDNDIVTISKLQVALIAPADNLQTELSDISRNADTDSDEGLVQLLQDSALTLLRHEEHWTHVASSSEACGISEAETIFNKLQFQERSKFSSETLVNVGGDFKTRAMVSPGDEDSGLYIVVTLLLGSADDKPLFGTIFSRDEVKAALETMAGLRSDYLMTFYLLWTPQQKPEALTYDEMLTEYADMMQL